MPDRYCKYSIGETITAEIDNYPGANWNYFVPIEVKGIIVGMEDCFINATPIYKVKLSGGDIVSIAQNKIKT